MISGGKSVGTEMATWSDERLIKECVDGNEEAWDGLIDKYKNLIYSIPIKYGLSRDDAGEIFQRVCLQLVAELPHLRNPASLPAWLITVSSHECSDWAHHAQRYQPIEGEERGGAVPPSEAPDRFLLELEQERILHEALSEIAPRCRELLRMLFFEDPARYGAAARLGAADCEDAVVAQLTAMVRQRFAYAAQDGHDYLDAEQNARVVTAAETYYRAMYRSSVRSWNRRDGHMFATLMRLLDARGPDSKAVVWAHNSHVGDASATEMGAAGEFNIGQLCREAFGRRCVSIGFGTDRGEVMAADDWDGEARVKQVRPCRPDSWEHVFQSAAPARSLTSWRADPDLAAALSRPRLERAIGVIYRPETELRSHYFQAHLSRQFDAFAWFAETAAVTPLAGTSPEGAPDTYPFGV